MSEEMLLRHCAPTLAGMKTGNMFSFTFKDEEEKKETFRRTNKMLVKKGLRMVPLRQKEGRTLIYVYRPSHLRRDLDSDTARALLKERGYCCGSDGRCITYLMKRLEECEDFPHEIGLFLGYPLEDVCGFIENNACGFKCVGCWKVYGDEEKAKKTFAKYKKCTAMYCSKWAEGKPMDRLVLAI